MNAVTQNAPQWTDLGGGVKRRVLAHTKDDHGRGGAVCNKAA